MLSILESMGLDVRDTSYSLCRVMGGSYRIVRGVRSMGVEEEG